MSLIANKLKYKKKTNKQNAVSYYRKDFVLKRAKISFTTNMKISETKGLFSVIKDKILYIKISSKNMRCFKNVSFCTHRNHHT